jgi:hypothetical protein
MKTVLIAGAGALVLAMAASAANAQEVSTGFVGLSYSDVEVGSSGGANLITADGTVAFDVGEGFEIQLDGNIASLDPGGNVDRVTGFGGTGHAFWDTETFKAGVFLGYQNLGDLLGFESTATGWGLEGRWAVSDGVTIGAVAGWGSINLEHAPDVDASSYRADISIFSSDNLRWDASWGQTTFDWGPFSGDTRIWTVGGEWQMADSPYSFIFNYADASSDFSSGDSSTWTIGVRRTFGGSLKDRDRTSSPFLGLPFNFGGISGLLAGQFSVLHDMVRCFEDDEGCPSDSAINKWIDGFDEDLILEDLCDFFDVDCNELEPT